MKKLFIVIIALFLISPEVIFAITTDKTTAIYGADYQIEVLTCLDNNYLVFFNLAEKNESQFSNYCIELTNSFIWGNAPQPTQFWWTDGYPYSEIGDYSLLEIPSGAGCAAYDECKILMLDEVLLKVVEQLTPNTAMFEVPTSTVTSLLANVTSQFSDAGTLLVVCLAAGIPLTFYVIKRLIGLIPKGK